MSSKPKGNGRTEFQATSVHVGAEEALTGNSVRDEEKENERITISHFQSTNLVDH